MYLKKKVSTLTFQHVVCGKNDGKKTNKRKEIKLDNTKKLELHVRVNFV